MYFNNRMLFLLIILALLTTPVNGICQETGPSDQALLLDGFRAHLINAELDATALMVNDLVGRYRVSDDVLTELTLANAYIQVTEAEGLPELGYAYGVKIYSALIARDFAAQLRPYGDSAGAKDNYKKYQWIKQLEMLTAQIERDANSADGKFNLLILTNTYLKQLYPLAEKNISNKPVLTSFELRERIAAHLKHIGVQQNGGWTGSSPLYQPGWDQITDAGLLRELKALREESRALGLSREHQRVCKSVIEFLEASQLRIATALLSQGYDQGKVKASLGDK